MLDIKADETRLRIAVLILNQNNAREDQRVHAYRIIDSLTMIGNPNYEKNLNFLLDLDKQITLNTLINRSVAIVGF